MHGLALVRRGGRRGTARRVNVLAVYVACPAVGCAGGWTSAEHRDVVDRARGLRRIEAAPSRIDALAPTRIDGAPVGA